MTARRRRSLLLLLIFSPVSEYAFAQRLACFPIRAGETAASVATRVTADPRNRHAAWFQIVDPASARVIPKGRYDRIHAGWRACIVAAPAGPVPSYRHNLRGILARLAVPVAPVLAMLNRVDSTYLLWGLLMVVIALTSRSIDDYVSNRQATLRLMKNFGERFVQEFDRPLVRERPSDRVIDSQLRFSPHRARVDVLLAPRNGRPYPNLADHRKNVEYDVSRVMQTMNNPRFVHGPLYAKGRWVVVPFQLTANSEQSGAK